MLLHTEPAEVALGRATVNLCALLDREMDAVCGDLLEEMAEASPCGCRRTTAAHRVVILCRSLADEIRRYEQLYWRHQHERETGQQEQEIEF